MNKLKNTIFLLCCTVLNLLAQKDLERNLFEKYNTYKELFYSNFIRIDWGGDGIGKFIERDSSFVNFGFYEKSGFSLPAAAHHPTKNRYWWGTDPTTAVNKSLCNLNPDLSNDIGLLAWSEDSGLYLGLYLAMLSTEYELLKRDNQQLQMKMTLEEIYLALQAFRRLNMTANRWITQYLEALPSLKCVDDWTEQTNGYSAITIRSDIPYHFWREFHKSAKKYTNYGLVNPPATDKFGKIPNEKAGYRCVDLPDGIPDVRNIYASSQLCCQGNPHCAYSMDDSPFAQLAPNDPRKIAAELHAEKFFSQDQVIGLLLGLAFVKKYIPEDAIHLGPDGPVSIFEMTKNIAKSLVLGLGGPSRGFYRPACIGKPDSYKGSNLCGYDWRFTKYGICEAVNFICAENICKGNFFNYSSILVQGFTLGNKPLVVNRAGDNENRRMNYTFYHMLLALSNPDRIPLGNSIKDGLEYAPWIEPFYPLIRMTLHDISEFDMKKAGKNYGFAYEQYLWKMQAILGSYADKGNCIPHKIKSDCYEGDYPHTNINCENGFIHHPDERTANRISEWFPYQQDLYGNGVDYMFMYNLYRLSFPHEKRPPYRLKN